MFMDNRVTSRASSALPEQQAGIDNAQLLTILESLSLELDTDAMAAKALQAATAVTGAQAGAIALLDADGRHLRYRWYSGFDEQDMSLAAMQQPFSLRHGIAGQVMRSGKTEIVPDYLAFPQALQSYIKAGVRSALSAPIFDRAGKIVGMLSLAGLREQRKFTPEHVRLAEMIARQLAVAIHREQLLLDQKKYARALKALSACNEVMMYASNEDELLREVCKVIVREEGYLGAWVAYKGEDVYQSLTPRAVAGVDLESLLLVEYTWNVNDPKCGMMPPGQAVRSGQPAIVRDVDHEKECECCRLLAKDVGFQSVLALPLVFENELSGVLTIYAAGVNAFGEQEILQLNNMARNLVYGIVSLRMRTEKQNAMKALRRSEHNLRNVINHEADGVMVLDDDNTIKFVNPALEKLLGKNSKELVGTDFGFPLTSDESSQIELINQASMPTQCEMRMTEADWEEKPARIVTMHDLSERIRLEQEREEHAKRQQLMLVETITAMSNAMASRDPYTAAHMERVSGLSVAIAEQLELEADRIEGIRLGGIIHDIGKLYVPAEILNRPGRLSPAEFDIIRSHAQVGYDIIKGVPFTWPVAEMVYQHHERIDGSGYPNGLKGDEITLEARILAVADVVEAMSSHRPYRPSLGMQPAIEEIRKNRGVYYDAEVVDACIEVVNSGGFQL